MRHYIIKVSYVSLASKDSNPKPHNDSWELSTLSYTPSLAKKSALPLLLSLYSTFTGTTTQKSKRSCPLYPYPCKRGAKSYLYSTMLAYLISPCSNVATLDPPDKKNWCPLWTEETQQLGNKYYCFSFTLAKTNFGFFSPKKEIYYYFMRIDTTWGSKILKAHGHPWYQ